MLEAAASSGDELRLVVSDNGEGMATEDLSHVFDRFYKGDASRQMQDGESGLGLAIVKSIVDMHGAKTSVVSKLGEGTTFEICMPVNLK